MRPDLTHDVPEMKCPLCEHALDRATMDPRNPDALPPQPGDVSVCLYCAAFLVFTETLHMRSMSEAEFNKLSAEQQRYLNAVRNFIRQ